MLTYFNNLILIISNIKYYSSFVLSMISTFYFEKLVQNLSNSLLVTFPKLNNIFHGSNLSSYLRFYIILFLIFNILNLIILYELCLKYYIFLLINNIHIYICRNTKNCINIIINIICNALLFSFFIVKNLNINLVLNFKK